MSEARYRSSALEQLSAVGFKLLDLHLYLDTHMGDQAIQNLYRRTQTQYEALKNEFEAQYGPLSISGAAGGAEWLKDPWPWDLEEAM